MDQPTLSVAVVAVAAAPADAAAPATQVVPVVVAAAPALPARAPAAESAQAAPESAPAPAPAPAPAGGTPAHADDGADGEAFLREMSSALDAAPVPAPSTTQVTAEADDLLGDIYDCLGEGRQVSLADVRLARTWSLMRARTAQA